MTKWITKKGKDGKNRHIPIQEGYQKKEKEIKTNQKTNEINMEKLRKDIERMNEELLILESRAAYEKNEEKVDRIVDKLGDKQWKFVEELKKKYGFKVWDDSEETVLRLKKGNIIVRIDFGYPDEIANNLIDPFFAIEEE